MSKLMQVLLATTLVLGTALADQPRTQQEARSVTVRYGDLDLGRQADVQALYRRLKSAARTVCQPLESADIRSRHLWRECRATALDQAVARSGSEPLMALHAGRAPALKVAASAAGH